MISTRPPTRGMRPTRSRPDQRTAEEHTVIGHETIEVLIGGYLSKDAAHEDYQAVQDCGAHLFGAVVVSKDLEGEADGGADRPHGREGADGLGAVGFASASSRRRCWRHGRVGAALGAGAGEPAPQRA